MTVVPRPRMPYRPRPMDAQVAETIQEEGSFTSPAAPGVTYHRITVSPAGAMVRARLVIIHGYGDHAGRYVEPMTWLASRGVACHGVDLRGHGRSSGRRAYVRRWDEYLEVVDALLSELDRRDERDRSPLFVLGHSHGGLVAAVGGLRQRLAARHVTGVILSAPYLVNAFRVPVHKSILARVANVCWPC